MPCLGKSPNEGLTWHFEQMPRPPQTESRSTPSARAAASTVVPAGKRPRWPDGVKITRGSRGYPFGRKGNAGAERSQAGACTPGAREAPPDTGSSAKGDRRGVSATAEGVRRERRALGDRHARPAGRSAAEKPPRMSKRPGSTTQSAASVVPEGKGTVVEHQRHVARFAGLERDLFERLELLGRARHRGLVADIELHHLAPARSPVLVTVAVTLTACSSDRRGEGREREAGVAEAEAEREHRRDAGRS